MRMGFVGAGKLGFTLGKYFTENGIDVSGYYSRSRESARDASEFTNSRQFSSLEEVVNSCDAVFLTVPDSTIEEVWNEIKNYSLKGKCICHSSGSMSSAVFSGIEDTGAYGYSIHPIFAVSSKYESYKVISKAYISIEGDEKYADYFKALFEKCGNPTRIISGANKTLYHAAAVFSSNLMIALYKMGAELLMKCGYDEEGALKALAPLMTVNAQSAGEKGPEAALTGPVERADLTTVRDHMEKLPEDHKKVYVMLSEELVKIAEHKNPEKDYTALRQYLKENHSNISVPD